MASYELMGLLALVILWGNALLMAAAALKDERSLAAWSRRFADGARGRGGLRLLHGRLEQGRLEHGEWGDASDPGSAPAELVVEQVGRAIDVSGGVGVQWNDRSYASRVRGGTLRTSNGQELEVAPGEGPSAAVWPSRETRARAGALGPGDDLTRTARAARTGRGALRTVVMPVGGDVFVFGEESGGKLVAPRDAAVVVAAEDPRKFCRRARALLWLFVVGELVVLAGITKLALTEPLFGAWSTAGGVLGLAFFLLVQPIGSWNVKNAVRLPHEAMLRGEWLPEKAPPRGARSTATL